MNVNVVAISGNLTRDPELRTTPGGTSVCSMRIAVNDRYKDSNGEWKDRPNYFNVTTWGAQGEACAQYLAKGRMVFIQGRLSWREWQADDGTKRQAVEIVSDKVQFVRSASDGESSSGDFAPPLPQQSGGAADDFGVGGNPDDDIPF